MLLLLCYLSRTAQDVPALTGPHEQEEAMLVSLVVQAAGQTDLSTVLIDAEQAAGVDEQVVGDWMLLEGKRRCHQESGEGNRSG